MFEILQFDFMQHALIAALLVSVICGIMGTLAVANRMVFLTGGIAHAAYGGIGLAYLLRLPYLIGTLGFSLIAALIMAVVSIRAKHRVDAIIGAIWAIGMALGIIFIDLTPGYATDLMSYLFGSMLAVPLSDLWVMALVAVVITTVVWFFYTDFLTMSYDEEFARIRGIAVNKLYILMICMLAVAVVLTIRIVGLILVIALMTIPPFIAEKYTRSMLRMMLLAALLSMIFSIVGLTAAYYLNLTAGACIILTAGIGYFCSLILDQVKQFRKSEHRPPHLPEAS